MKIDVKIGSISMQIESDDKEKVLSLASQIDDKIRDIKKNFNNLPDIKAILIMALILQDEANSLSKLEASFKEQSINNSIELQSLVTEIMSGIDNISRVLSMQ